MAISKDTIRGQVSELIQANKKVKPEEAEKAFADGLAGIIEAAIKSATVTVEAGIPVATAGTAAAQTGNTTGPGTGSLS